MKNKKTEYHNLFSVFVMWVNFHSLGRFVSLFQVVASSAKLLAMALIIVAGFYLLIFQGSVQRFIAGIWSTCDTTMLSFTKQIYLAHPLLCSGNPFMNLFRQNGKFQGSFCWQRFSVWAYGYGFLCLLVFIYGLGYT